MTALPEVPGSVLDRWPEYPRAYCERRVLDDGTVIKFCWCAIYSAKHGRDIDVCQHGWFSPPKVVRG